MRMISGFGYRNPEGYPDPTAYSAINNVEKTPVENKNIIRIMNYCRLELDF